MSLASRLASVHAFSNIRALFLDIEHLESRAAGLQDIVDDMYEAWLTAMCKDVKTTPEAIALAFMRAFMASKLHERAYAIINSSPTVAARQRACITCSAAAQVDRFHRDDADWPAGHIKSGLYKEEE